MSNNNMRILVIEDFELDIMLLEVFFKEANYKYILFILDFLLEGLEKLWECLLDIVLFDFNLLDVIGFKILQQFREKVFNMLVIVMIGYKNEIMGIQFVRVGVQDFLVKGIFDYCLLVKIINYFFQCFVI